MSLISSRLAFPRFLWTAKSGKLLCFVEQRNIHLYSRIGVVVVCSRNVLVS
jgi:hypothetical protein